MCVYIAESSPNSRGKSTCMVETNPKVFDINELVQVTRFNKSEIQFIYRDFKLVNGQFTLILVESVV